MSQKAIRLDSVPITRAFFTPEGYLKDRPIVTSCGVFEYKKKDGTVKRELRLPEDVFNADSLSSYEGKPIIITHDAGLVTKDNVTRHQIGTILTEGYRSGNDVRAKVVIHDTNEMKRCGLRELSLGYELDLEENPGVWNGQPYDSIQRNIRINHLALVRDARAGDQARLNLDGREEILDEGDDVMKQICTDGAQDVSAMSADEFMDALNQIKANHNIATDANPEPEITPEVPVEEPMPEEMVEDGAAFVEGELNENVEDPQEDANDAIPADGHGIPEQMREEMPEETIEETDAAEEPVDLEGKIAEMENEIQTLIAMIDKLQAERDFDAADIPGEPLEENPFLENNDAADEPAEEPIEETVENMEPTEEENTDGCNSRMDSADKIRKDAFKLGMMASRLNMDNLEGMSIKEAKQAVILAKKPSLRLDGKSDTYIDAMFDFACEDMTALNRKGTNYQKQQIFNKDAAEPVVDSNSAENARKRMIERRNASKTN